MINKRIRLSVKHAYESGNHDLSKLSKHYGVKYRTIQYWVHRYHWKNHHFQHGSRTDLAVHGLMNDGLSLATNKFIMYYLNSFNGRLSYHKVHPKAKWNTCEVNASQLLSNTKVQNVMKSIKSKQYSGMLLNANDIIHEYAKRAFSNITDVVDVGTKVGTDDSGKKFRYNYLYLKNNDDADYSTVESIKKGRDGSISVKMPNKDHALDVLLKNAPKSKDNGIHFPEAVQQAFMYPLQKSEKKRDALKAKLLQARTRKENAEAKIKKIEAQQMSAGNHQQASQMERVLKSFDIPDPSKS